VPPTLAAVIVPNAEPGGDYYEGYMAGVSFAEDAWNRIGVAALWLDQYSLTATDVAVQKALMALPPSIVENHSPVWIEAFRAGASLRFDQFHTYATKRAVPVRILAIVLASFATSLLIYLITPSY